MVDMPQIKPFRNPIVPGFNPDPSCILVDGTYYLVTSSFLYTPGIPIYTSKDLINWTQIGNVVTRPSQLSLEQCTIRPGTKNCGGLWAPTIRHHKGVFYVCTTCVFPDKEYADHSRWENVIWKTTDPHAPGSWSDGVRFYFPGYDTSLFWDEENDDKVYVQGSTYWRVQEGIAQVELDLDTGASLSGEPKQIWPGTGRRIPEAPHMYRKDGWYYLLIAEGGTELEHCATIARSKSVWGPFDACPDNPIIHAADKGAYFQTIGHADIFQGVDGQWFAVALATRDGRVNFPMGRETVLIPGRWDAGQWPAFDARVESVMMARPGDANTDGPAQAPIDEDVLANFQFGGPGFDVLWPPNLLRLRNPDERSYTAVQPPGARDPLVQLSPSGRGDTLSGRFGSPTFVARRQTAIECTTEVELGLPAGTSAELVAGVSVYLDCESHLDLVLTPEPSPADQSGRWRATVRRCTTAADVAPDSPEAFTIVDGGAVRVIARPDRYEFYGRRDGSWVLVGQGAASDVSGGFTGVVIGPFVEGTGATSADRVDVRKWVYAEP